MKRVLILGGTSEAAALAATASQLPEIEVITSLAGRTSTSLAPATAKLYALPGTVRSGGFGGATGLIQYLQEHQIDCLIDATHPFAAQISWNAAEAATACKIPRLMLRRSAWQPTEGDRWLEVESHTAAAAILPELAARVFLTIGRQELAAYAHLHLWFLMRMIDPPAEPLPPGTVILERGPFEVEQERRLLQQHDIGAIVSKNSGGTATYAKIVAARELRLPIVMVQRPEAPPGEQVETIEAALKWLEY